jgi:hypothetical protein
MIYSDDFVWLHFPRCAGTKIEQLFGKYFAQDNQIIQDVIDPDVFQYISWHDSVAEREARRIGFLLGNRTVICSFRKLPSWLVSRYSFEYYRSPSLKHQPEQLLEGKFLEQSGLPSHADYYAMKYLPRNILDSGNVRFIRTEYFEYDFKLVFSEFLDIYKIPDWEFQRKANVSRNAVPNEILNELYDSDEIYGYCPYWREVEKIVYG